MQQNKRLFVIENSRNRVVAAARDAGHARMVAALLLLGSSKAPERDALVVREPEEEEAAEFELRRPGPGSGFDLSAIPL